MEAGPADRLLEWCSLRRFGHRADFERACLTTVGPDERARSVLGRLEQLGHVDVGWDSGQAWWIARPALVVCSGAGGRAVLTGARTRATMNALVRWKLDGRIPSLDVLAQPRTAPAAGVRRLQERARTVRRRRGDRCACRDRRLPALSVALRDAGRHVAERSTRVPSKRFRGGGAGRRDPAVRADRRPERDRASRVLSTADARHHGVLVRRRRRGRLPRPTVGGDPRRAPTAPTRARLPEQSVLEYDVRTQRMAVSSDAQLPLPWARVAMAASGRLPSHVRGTSGRLLEVFDGIEPVLYKEICDALGAPPMSFRELEPGVP